MTSLHQMMIHVVSLMIRMVLNDDEIIIPRFKLLVTFFFITLQNIKLCVKLFKEVKLTFVS